MYTKSEISSYWLPLFGGQGESNEISRKVRNRDSSHMAFYMLGCYSGQSHNINPYQFVGVSDQNMVRLRCLIPDKVTAQLLLCNGVQCLTIPYDSAAQGRAVATTIVYDYCNTNLLIGLRQKLYQKLAIYK